jgi:hypothetical protein
MLVSHVLKLASGDINNQEEGKKALRIILVREKRHAWRDTHAVMQIHGCTGGQSTMAYVGSFDKNIHKIKYRSGGM